MQNQLQVLSRIAAAILLLFCPAWLAAQTPATCGQSVTGDITFNGDLYCPEGLSGIRVVGQDGVTIDLAGFTLGCGSDGVTCVTPGSVGIYVENSRNITIKGPGTINGFEKGIHATSSSGRSKIEDLNITGIDPTKVDLYWPFGSAANVGIHIQQPQGTVIVNSNDVSGHSVGIKLDGATGVKVQGNYVHHNSADPAESYGILLSDSPDNVVTGNDINLNGRGLAAPGGGALGGGLTLWGSATTGNRVAQNNVDQNCGDGISVRDGATSNSISNNSAVGNPAGGGSGTAWCYDSPASTSFDIANRSTGENRISKTNDCTTEYPTGLGVCP